jgi:hypothetical protein
MIKKDSDDDNSDEAELHDAAPHELAHHHNSDMPNVDEYIDTNTNDNES